MKLELNEKEVEKVLLDWAEQHWPGRFNKVTGESGYRCLQCCEFSFEKKEDDECPTE